MNSIGKRFKNNLHTDGYLVGYLDGYLALKSTLMWHSFLNLHKKAILELRKLNSKKYFTINFVLNSVHCNEIYFMKQCRRKLLNIR